MATKETLAIAIDFGTTYSGSCKDTYLPEGTRLTGSFVILGIAYARVEGMRGMLPTQLGTWPGQPPTRNSYKVPTIVAYPVDHGGLPLWGFEAERSTQIRAVTYLRMRVFKPFLDPAISDQCLTPPGKRLSDVVHDYLQGLYTHLTQTLEKEGLSGKEVNYNFLLTVPATYGNAAVENFRRIIKTTGIGNHSFDVNLTEPEAAALYTIEVQPMRTSPNYKV